MTRRPRLGRAVAAITGASVALLMAAIPASAEEDPVTAKVTDKHEAGLDINLVLGGKTTQYSTELSEIQLKDNGPTFQTYPLVPGGVLKEGADLIELPWLTDQLPDDKKLQMLAKAAAGEDPFKQVNWALRHSFPFLSVDALKSTLALDKALSNSEAIAGTQAAMWHMIFGFDLDTKTPTPGNDASAARVTALYDHLTGQKNTGADNDVEPRLEITSATISGKAGERVGPVKVKTTAKELTVSLPAGVKLTDKDGNELAAKDIRDGSELFFQVPAGAAGQGTFELATSGEVSRVFFGGEVPDQQSELKAMTEIPEVPFQFLVFAQKVRKSVGTTVEWTTTTTPETPAPQASNGGGLANTGVSIYVPLGLGVLLLAAGAGALLLLRRRGRA